MTELTPTIRAALRGVALVRLKVAAAELELATRAICEASPSESVRAAFGPDDQVGDEDVAMIRHARNILRELGRLEVTAEQWAESARIADDTPPETLPELLEIAERARIREDLASTPRRDRKS